MVIKTASPGIVINEVDLTRGTSDAITTNIAAFAGPFAKGPVDELTLIETEAQLQQVFGDPTDENYEYWYTVSNYLEYGGVCYVTRCDDTIGVQTMKNATSDGSSVFIKNRDHFDEDFDFGVTLSPQFAAREPGTYGNNLGIAVIDRGADFALKVSQTGIVAAADGSAVSDNTALDSFTAGTILGSYIQVTAATNTDSITVGDFVQECDAAGSLSGADGEGFVVAKDGDVHTILVTAGDFALGTALTADGGSTFTAVSSASDDLATLTAYSRDGAYKLSAFWSPASYTVAQGEDFGWTLTPKPSEKVTSGGPAAATAYVWRESLGLWVASVAPTVDYLLTDGTNVYSVAEAPASWYDAQIAFAGLPWYRFAGRPGTSQHAAERGASNDEVNIIIYDATGELTNSKGNVLESYFGVSKLVGAKTPEGDNNYYADVLRQRSAYVYAGSVLSEESADLNTALSSSATGTAVADGVSAEYVEAKTYTLSAGVDNLYATLGELQAAYNKLTLENVTLLDYILQGPNMSNLDDSVAKSNFLISVAEERKDCMALVTPPRYAVVGVASPATVTENILEWANELTSSSYAIIDSGYKYSYDRYNDTYRHLPLNGDIAGLLVNTSINAQPWFSPAGLSRGQIRNVVKLTYNPSKAQRDELYTARVNPVVTFPGEGTILFGDKTALGYSSAFDRINVRRLFLVIEREIAKMSRTVLFEFNDETTRTLFKNNVNPYLRDVQAKRGMYDFLVVCDETNNTPEVIDRNELIADIYIKPSKSVNFISLNFIATKTGVSFDESVALFRGN